MEKKYFPTETLSHIQETMFFESSYAIPFSIPFYDRLHTIKFCETHMGEVIDDHTYAHYEEMESRIGNEVRELSSQINDREFYTRIIELVKNKTILTDEILNGLAENQESMELATLNGVESLQVVLFLQEDAEVQNIVDMMFVAYEKAHDMRFYMSLCRKYNGKTISKRHIGAAKACMTQKIKDESETYKRIRLDLEKKRAEYEKRREERKQAREKRKELNRLMEDAKKKIPPVIHSLTINRNR